MKLWVKIGDKILLLFNKRFNEFLVIPGSGGKELLWGVSELLCRRTELIWGREEPPWGRTELLWGKAELLQEGKVEVCSWLRRMSQKY